MIKNKRKKISILNILFLVLILSLITSIAFKNRENLKNIFTKKNKIKALQETNLDKLEIGDIVYYNQKKAADLNNESNQTVTIEAGDSANPGYGKIPKTEEIINKVYKWKKYIVNLTKIYDERRNNETGEDHDFEDNMSAYTNYILNTKTGEFELTNYKSIGTSDSNNKEYYKYFENNKRIILRYQVEGIYGLDLGVMDQGTIKERIESYVSSTQRTKGTYINTVESKNQKQYPKNNVSGSYWYEYIGEEERKETVITGEYSEPQIFNAKNYDTTWRVWDKLSDGRVMLVSNRTVPYADTNKNLKRFNTYGAVGHIWWEHNAHKVASIFGYGEGADLSATKDFAYKVGSGIDDAPDMIEVDKGNWKIGEELKDKINISAARSLTLAEVEEKLGITDEGIKNKTTSSSTNSSGPGYGIQTTTRMDYVVQRDINSPNQKWEKEEDRKIGKAKNKKPDGYKMTDRYYYWNKDSIPVTKYKDMLFNGINNWNGLATNALYVYREGSNVNFNRGYVLSSSLGLDSPSIANFYDSSWDEYDVSPSLRVAVYLKSKIKYLPAGANAWDIYEASSKDKDLKLKVLNLSSEPASKIGIEIGKANVAGVALTDAIGRLVAKQEVDGKIEYTVKAKKFDGQKRDENTTGDNATFSKIDNKYNVLITGIPEGYDFKIIGKTGKQIDLDTDTNLEYELVIYPKAGTQNVQVAYKGGKNDSNFAVTGNVVIKSGDEILGRTDGVTLKRGVNSVPVDNVDLFDKIKNELKDYIVEFEKSADDPSLHTVEYNPKTKKLVVTYVSPKKEITVSVVEDSKKYLTNITEIKLKLVGGEERAITLKPTDFTTKLNVPKTDKDGNEITYSLQKVENVPGYYLSIDGFNVNLKPILKLPYTGAELSSRNIAIISLSIFGIALAFRFRKKLVLVFKEYTMMK